MVAATNNLQPPRFRYGMATVDDLRVRRVERSRAGKVALKDLEIEGQQVRATKRFWRSFFTRFGIAENVFRYFSPAEVFSRIGEVNQGAAFRYCVVERHDLQDAQPGEPRRELLAVTSPQRPVIHYSEVIDLLQRYGGLDVHYHDGLVHSSHSPRGGSREFAIGGDQFRDRFCLETPIDGYGHPRLFLSLLRLVCSNGMVGYSRTFRSDIPVGKHMDHCLTRALESFDNGDGYVALRQRFASSQSSWASVQECVQLAGLLEKLEVAKELTCQGLLGRLHTIAGNLNELYGLSNIEALSDKRQRILPSRARVYDLLNFASEIASHHAKPSGANRIQAYIGSLISDEYDLEGTAEVSTDFDAFFLDQPVVSQSA
ncbi:DUF932 domain-containing protein [Planctomycetaceae bacterium SH139]